MKTTSAKNPIDEQPFGPPRAPQPGTVGRAIGTMLLALYPVVAAIAVVMAGLAVAAPS